MEQHFQNTSSFDYTLKEGETIHIEIKNVSLLLSSGHHQTIMPYIFLMKFCSYWCQQKSSSRVKSKFFEQGMNNLSLEDKGDGKEPKIFLKPPPPPPSPLSPSSTVQEFPSFFPPDLSLEGASKGDTPGSGKEDSEKQHSSENQSTQDIADDDFGDFQAAG